MFYAAARLHLHPTAVELFGFLALCVVGILIHYSLMFMLAAISFWTVRAQGIVWGYYNLFNIARMPDEAFRGVFKVVFTFVLPVLLVSNVPVRVLADKLQSPALWLVLLGMGVICAVISEWFWRVSVRRYTSASTWLGQKDVECRKLNLRFHFKSKLRETPQQVPTNTDHVIINSGSVIIPSRRHIQQHGLEWRDDFWRTQCGEQRGVECEREQLGGFGQVDDQRGDSELDQR